MKFKLSQLVKVGAFAVPIVPAASMAHSVFIESSKMEIWGQFTWLIVGLALAGGFAFELVGIGAGHMSIRFFVSESWTFFTLSVVALLAYVLIGLVELGFTTFGLFLIIAPFVYLLSGMLEVAEQQADDIKESAKIERERNLEADRRKAEMERARHEIELEEMKATAEFKRSQQAKDKEAKRQRDMAKMVSGNVAQGVASGLQQLVKLVADESLVQRVLPEVKGTKKIIIETLVATPSATRSQLATKAGVSPQAISNHTNSLAKKFFDVATGTG